MSTFTGGGLTPHKDGFRGRVSYYEDGKRKYKTKVFKLPKRQAQEAFNNWRQELEHEASKKKTDITVGDFLYSRLQIEEQLGTVEPSTIAGYLKLIKRMNCYIGDIKLTDLSSAHIEQMVYTLLEEELSPNTVRKILARLKCYLNEAVNHELIDRNPANKVKAPKSRRPERYSLTKDATSSLISVLDNMEANQISVAVLLALCAGLRLSEVCALQWGDVDFSSKTEIYIHIRRSIGRDKNGAHYLKEPKCHSSRRTIPVVAQELATKLKALKVSQMEDCMHTSVRFSDSLFVIGYIDGSPCSPMYLSKQFRGFADLLSLKNSNGSRLTFHELRHTFATEAISNGVDIEATAAMLGHAKPSMTLDVYGHARPEAKLEGAKKLAEAFSRRPKECQIMQFPKVVGGDN